LGLESYRWAETLEFSTTRPASWASAEAERRARPDGWQEEQISTRKSDLTVERVRKELPHAQRTVISKYSG
jgi:hypothetical protein